MQHWISRPRVDSAVSLVDTKTGIHSIAIYLLNNWTGCCGSDVYGGGAGIGGSKVGSGFLVLVLVIVMIVLMVLGDVLLLIMVVMMVMLY